MHTHILYRHTLTHVHTHCIGQHQWPGRLQQASPGRIQPLLRLNSHLATFSANIQTTEIAHKWKMMSQHHTVWGTQTRKYSFTPWPYSKKESDYFQHQMLSGHAGQWYTKHYFSTSYVKIHRGCKLANWLEIFYATHIHTLLRHWLWCYVLYVIMCVALSLTNNLIQINK